jgi:hypothetical protein
MNQDDIAMGYFGGPGNLDFFIIVTLTALKALQLVRPGLDPERSPLV